jgi:hypothetical protein
MKAARWTARASAQRNTTCRYRESPGIISRYNTRVTDMNDSREPDTKVIYWHRDLPPLDAEPIAEHTVEANSLRLRGTLDHRSELWEQCYADLMTQLGDRLRQEIMRLGGQLAHVLDESIESRRDDVTGEVWLHGRVTYSLLRRPRPGQ